MISYLRADGRPLPLNPKGPTAQVMKALIEGPKTNRELQNELCLSDMEIRKVTILHRAYGNLTRSGPPRGSIYTLTREGRERLK